MALFLSNNLAVWVGEVLLRSLCRYSREGKGEVKDEPRASEGSQALKTRL